MSEDAIRTGEGRGKEPECAALQGLWARATMHASTG